MGNGEIKPAGTSKSRVDVAHVRVRKGKEGRKWKEEQRKRQRTSVFIVIDKSSKLAKKSVRICRGRSKGITVSYTAGNVYGWYPEGVWLPYGCLTGFDGRNHLGNYVRDTCT